MLGRLIRKEIAHHLLDRRFIAVFALCAGLSALSIYVGTQNYLAQRLEHDTAAETRHQWVQGQIDAGNALSIGVYGYHWSRPPEILSPFVYGLSGTLGREVGLYSRPLAVHQILPFFQSSPQELNPALRLFGILDLAFIVKIVLSLAVLLFTHDAVCGEKEEGTLRLYNSFPVSRATIAAAKMLGSTLAVLTPFVFAFLLACTVMVLSPDISLSADDWARIGGLMLVFGLYLSVFAGFGLWASALTHRRLLAFLWLLGLWAIWLYLVPMWLFAWERRFGLKRVCIGWRRSGTGCATRPPAITLASGGSTTAPLRQTGAAVLGPEKGSGTTTATRIPFGGLRGSTMSGLLPECWPCTGSGVAGWTTGGGRSCFSLRCRRWGQPSFSPLNSHERDSVEMNGSSRQ